MIPYKVFDTIIDLVFVVDADFNLFYGNNAAALLFEVSNKRLQSGKPIANFIEFKQGLVETGTSLVDVEESSQYREIEFTTANGKEGCGGITLQLDPLQSAETPREQKRWIVYVRDVSLEKTLAGKYQRELDQKEEVIEDLKKARAQLEDYSKNLEKMVEVRTAELQEANGLLKAILDSLGQGILVFDQNGQCLPFFSKVCTDILEHTPDGRPVAEILRLNDHEKVEFLKWRDALFGDMLPFEDIAMLGPGQFQHSQDRHIALNFNPMRDSSGTLKAVVMVATDKTAEIQAKREAERERAFARLVTKIAEHRGQFRSFAAEAKVIFSSMRQDARQPAPLNFEETARYLHTIKGGASSFALGDLAQAGHEAEQFLIDTHKKTGDINAPDFRAAFADRIDAMHVSFEEFLDKHVELFGGKIENTGRAVEVAWKVLLNWSSAFARSRDTMGLAREIFDFYVQEPVEKSFAHMQSGLTELASALGKKLTPVIFEGGETLIVPEHFGPLFATFIHIFRNAVDHGMELPEVRVHSGKPEAGQIRMKFERIDRLGQKRLRFEIADDGGGIDPARIRAKLLEKGRRPEEIPADDKAVIQSVFADDFSTRDQVTEISGRGVGLSAVRKQVEKMGGWVRVESVAAKGTRFIVDVPDHLEPWSSGAIVNLVKSA